MGLHPNAHRFRERATPQAPSPARSPICKGGLKEFRRIFLFYRFSLVSRETFIGVPIFSFSAIIFSGAPVDLRIARAIFTLRPSLFGSTSRSFRSNLSSCKPKGYHPPGIRLCMVADLGPMVVLPPQTFASDFLVRLFQQPLAESFAAKIPAAAQCGLNALSLDFHQPAALHLFIFCQRFDFAQQCLPIAGPILSSASSPILAPHLVISDAFGIERIRADCSTHNPADFLLCPCAPDPYGPG